MEGGGEISRDSGATPETVRPRIESGAGFEVSKGPRANSRRSFIEMSISKTQHALRRLGYRSEYRYLVFQALPHTTGLPVETWRVLMKAHERRNLAEYEGHLERDDRPLAGLLAAALP